MRLVIVLAALAAACSTAGLEATPEQDLLTAPVAGQLALPEQLGLYISRAPLVAGRWIDLEVSGATPGAQVGVAVSNGVPGPGACPGWIGDCLDITRGTSGYTFLLLGTADAFGNVRFSATLPRSFAAGTWSFQALSPSGTGGSFVGSGPVTVDVVPFRTNCVGDDGFENDDSGAQATPIGVGHSSTGRVLCDQDDIDWHSIELTAGEEIAIDVSFIDDEGDLDVYVVEDADRNNLTILDNNFLARGYSSSDDENITFTAPYTGTFYIAVREYVDAGTSPGNVYDLDVTGLVIPVNTCTIDFADAWALLGEDGDPNAYYNAYGVSFTEAIGYGLVAGEINGDPGSWTSDPNSVPDEAWGCWTSSPANVNTFSFDSPVTDLSFTAYTGNPGDLTTLVVEGFIGTTSLGQQSFDISYAGNVAVFPFIAGPVDTVRLFASFSATGAYIIDDIAYTTDSLVCP